MAEPVEQRGGEFFGAKDLDPLAESEIGGDDGRASFVAVSQQVKEQLAAGFVERHKAELIADEQIDTQIAPLESAELPVIARLDELADQIRGADKCHSLSSFCRFDSESRCEHGLAGADGTRDDDVVTTT